MNWNRKLKVGQIKNHFRLVFRNVQYLDNTRLEFTMILGDSIVCLNICKIVRGYLGITKDLTVEETCK